MFDRLVLNAVMLFLLFVGCAIYAPNASAQGSTIADTGAVTGTVTGYSQPLLRNQRYRPAQMPKMTIIAAG